jgi:heavy metal efflux system protein
MLNWIIDFSLRHRVLVIIGVTFLAALGGVSLRFLDIDAFPDTTPVQVANQHSSARSRTRGS